LVIFLVFLVLIVLSILTLQKLSSPQAIENNLTDAQRKQRKKRIGSAVRMVLYSLLLHCFCCFPYNVFQLLRSSFHLLQWDHIDWYNSCYDLKSLSYMIVYFLPILNCSLSPGVYFVCLSDFRQAAKSVMCKEVTKNNSNSTSTTVETKL